MSFKEILLLPDDHLLAQCREERFRGPGAGGQKRNKTSNAMRLTHEPTGVSVSAGEARSLVENRTRALKRLRLQIAAEVRTGIDLANFEPPDWFLPVRRQKRMEVSTRNLLFAPIGALILDLLEATGGNPAAVAVNLGVSTSSVVKLLEEEPILWTAANKIRAAHDQPPLNHPR